MTDLDIDRFEVRPMTYREVARHLAYTKSMLFAAIGVSFAIVSVGAVCLSFLV